MHKAIEVLRKDAQAVFQWLDSFFYNSKNSNLGIFRILLGLVIFYLSVMKSYNLEYFSPNGIVSKEQSMGLFHELVRPMFSWNFWTDDFYLIAHLSVIALSFLFTIGLLGRVLSFLLFALYMGFIHRNYAVLFGADVISALFLFYFTFARGNRDYTVFQFLPIKPLQIIPESWDHLLNSVGLRLLQLQVIVIYTYTGFEKFRGSSWWNGTAVWTVISNPQMVIWDLNWMHHFPLIIGVLTFSAMIFEVFFGCAMTHPKIYKYWLSIGVMFHLLIGIIMDLMPFSVVMIATYILFLDETLIREGILRLRKSRKKTF
jgi:hypothetical protein